MSSPSGTRHSEESLNKSSATTNSSESQLDVITCSCDVYPLRDALQQQSMGAGGALPMESQGASAEIENGYPLVADLQQIRFERVLFAIVNGLDEQSPVRDEAPDPALPGNSQEDVDHVDHSNKDTGPLRNGADHSERHGNQFGIEYMLANSSGAVSTDAKNCKMKEYLQHNTVAKSRGANETSVAKDNPDQSSGFSLGWQAEKGSLKERFSFLFRNEVLADVYFNVGQGKKLTRIPAHKFVVVTGSSVFDAMFNGNLSTKESEIHLPDVEPGAFVTLLRFLYTDEIRFRPENVMAVLYAAKKYAVLPLERACINFLKKNLCPDNACMLLTQARFFDEPQLANLCLEAIDKNTLEAVAADTFLNVDHETLCAILERNTLRIREAQLFQAVIRWSLKECFRLKLSPTPSNQRDVLGKALYLIRFPLMTVEEFAQHPAQSGILKDNETVGVFLYFTLKSKPPSLFSDTARCCEFSREVVVNRFQRVEGRWGYNGLPDRIKFTVDRRIYVLGFGLLGAVLGPVEYPVTIQILHCGTGKVLASNKTSFTCDGSSNTFRVFFKAPVEIDPCVTYIASARLQGPDSHYGTKGLRRIVHQSPSTGITTFQFTYAAGNNNGTSVEDGQIPEIIYCTKTV